MVKYLIEFEGGIEPYIAATEEDAFDCAKYLLGKYKDEYPWKRAHIQTVSDEKEVTWPRKTQPDNL